MKQLEVPFQDSIELIFQTGNRKKNINCELATSEIEIFQSLTLRKKKDFKIPLVLFFKNPLKQSFSLQGFNFPVEQFCVDYTNDVIKKINKIRPTKSQGEFIQSYSEFSLVILSPLNYFPKGLIVLNKTKVTF
jgi:hypothetical protein